MQAGRQASSSAGLAPRAACCTPLSSTLRTPVGEVRSWKKEPRRISWQEEHWIPSLGPGASSNSYPLPRHRRVGPTVTSSQYRAPRIQTHSALPRVPEGQRQAISLLREEQRGPQPSPAHGRRRVGVCSRVSQVWSWHGRAKRREAPGALVHASAAPSRAPFGLRGAPQSPRCLCPSLGLDLRQSMTDSMPIWLCTSLSTPDATRGLAARPRLGPWPGAPSRGHMRELPRPGDWASFRLPSD